MEGSKVEKRVILDNSDEGLVQPTLVRINKQSCAPPNIHIDKNEVFWEIHISVLLNVFKMESFSF